MNEFNNLKIFNFLRQAKIDNAALTQEELYMNVLKKAVDSEILPNEVLIKARSGVYADTPENRKKGRIGTRYGAKVHGGDTYDLENGKKPSKEDCSLAERSVGKEMWSKTSKEAKEKLVNKMASLSPEKKRSLKKYLDEGDKFKQADSSGKKKIAEDYNKNK